MKTGILKSLACGLGALAMVSTAGATPVQRGDLPAEPAWLLHLDCDALRPTSIGQFILSEMQKPENEAKLAAFQALFNFDLRKQLHGLTLYSIGSSPVDGVALVYADFDANRLTTLAKAAHDHQSTDYKQYVIHNWIDDNKKAVNGVKPRTYAAICGGRVIFGQKEERVAQALDVLDHTVATLATSKSLAQLGAAGRSGIIQAIARKLELPDSDPNATMFRLSKLVCLDVADAQGQVNATLTLEAKDEEVAGHLASIAQGLVALGKLQTEKPETVKLAEAVSLKQEGARVVATIALPATAVVELMKADAARKAAKKAAK